MDPRVARTRAAVLEATRAVLADGGLEAANVNAVAARAGVNKTTIYRNWPDPRDLVHEALADLSYHPAPPDTGSLRSDLLTMFTGLAASLQSPPWDRLLPSVVGAAGYDERTRALHGSLTRQRRDLAAVVVDRAIERGEIPALEHPVDLVEMIAGPIYYRLLMTHEPVTDDDVAEIVDRTLQGLSPGDHSNPRT